MQAGGDDGILDRLFLFLDLDIDPIEQDNSIVDHDPCQGNHSQKGHEAIIGSKNNQPGDHPDYTQGDGTKHHKGFAKGIELYDQQDEDNKPRQW